MDKEKAKSVSGQIKRLCVDNGLFYKASEDHVVTLTSGTFNGTNTIATFADIADSLFVIFDSAGKGTIILNTGAVALSGP